MLIAGRALLIGGLSALLALVLAAFVGWPLVSRADTLLTRADTTMTTAARAAREAADAFDGVDASLTEARGAADDAATLATDASATAARLADAMTLSILGAQPLLPLSADFDRSSQQLAALGESLGRMRDALATNSGDLDRVQTQMRALADRLSEGESQLPGTGLPPLRLVALLGLLVLALPAAGSAVAGWALLRSVARV